MMQDIIRKVQGDMFCVLNSDQIQRLGNTLQLELGNYNIARKDSTLTIYNPDANLELIKMYFTAKMVEGLSRKSLNFYRIVLNSFFSSVKRGVLEVSTNDVRQYFAIKSLQDKVSNVTLNNYRSVLQSLYGWLQEEEHLLKNPMAKIKPIKIPKRIKEHIVQEDMEKLRDCCKTLRDRAIIEVLYSSGMRVGELVNINISDINFQDKMIKVIGKGDKQRMVYLSTRAVYTLKLYLKTRTDDNPALFINMNHHKNQPRINIAGVEMLVRKLGQQIGIRVHPHKFRRTMATTALSGGMQINEVRKALGHEKVDTTLTYAQTLDANVQIAYNKCFG